MAFVCMGNAFYINDRNGAVSGLVPSAMNCSPIIFNGLPHFDLFTNLRHVSNCFALNFAELSLSDVLLLHVGTQLNCFSI